MAHSINWHTAKVKLTEQGRLVLTVQLAVDPALILSGEAVPNPIWREKFNHAASSRKREWQRRNLHWGVPEIDEGGTITVAPVDSALSEAGLLPGELDSLVERAEELEDGEWKRLELAAIDLTRFFKSIG